jgi:colicin import membrane protein
MPRKLKTFQTSLGFYDLAIAAPSMKAALEAWGAGSNLFHQGFAKETDDADVVAATMSRPGVVLRRPAGSNGRFREDADLPIDLGCDEVGARRERTRSKANKRRPPKISESAARKAAALEFEREQKRREAERLREEASRRRERERREEAVAKAQAALDKAREKHEAKASAIEAERAEVEKRAEDEKARWEKQKEKLQTALREARE